MDFLIYACFVVAVVVVIGGLWGRTKQLRKSEERLRQLTKDLSEHRRAEEELRKRNERLEARAEQQARLISEANQEVERFFHPISHELRAPLRAIRGFAGILRDEHAHKLDPEMARLFDRIESSAHRMGQLVDDLLAFSAL